MFHLWWLTTPWIVVEWVLVLEDGAANVQCLDDEAFSLFNRSCWWNPYNGFPIPSTNPGGPSVWPQTPQVPTRSASPLALEVCRKDDLLVPQMARKSSMEHLLTPLLNQSSNGLWVRSCKWCNMLSCNGIRSLSAPNKIWNFDWSEMVRS